MIQSSSGVVTGMATHSSVRSPRGAKSKGKANASPQLVAPAVAGPGVSTRSHGVRKGHTVHLGAATGLVHSVVKGRALVHWISGAESWHPCRNLVVVRALGRLKLSPRPQSPVPRFLSEALG